MHEATSAAEGEGRASTTPGAARAGSGHRHSPETVAATALAGLRRGPVRPEVVRRVGGQLAAGTYDPPMEHVVERLLDVLRSGARHCAPLEH